MNFLFVKLSHHCYKLAMAVPVCTTRGPFLTFDGVDPPA